MRLQPLAAAVVTVGVLGWSAGCGGDSLGRQPVTGLVNVDGKPVAKGNVSFQPMTKGATGGTAIGGGAAIADGKFSIARKDGLPAGKYRVAINAPVPGTESAAPSGLPGESPPPPQELIPPEWNLNSEHFVEVTNGKNDFNFDVQTKKK